VSTVCFRQESVVGSVNAKQVLFEEVWKFNSPRGMLSQFYPVQIIVGTAAWYFGEPQNTILSFLWAQFGRMETADGLQTKIEMLGLG